MAQKKFQNLRKIQFKFPQIRNEFQGMLESEDWQQDSDFYTYGKVYKNVSPYIKIGGVNSAPTLENKKVTVPAVDSETQISLSASGYNVSFNSAVNLLLDSKNTTIKTNYGSNTISDAQTQITSPVVGNDTTRTLTNGENITNILLERISGGDIFLSVDGTKIIYSIGGNLIKGTDNDETITSSYYGATIDAKGGNDYISIAGAISNVISLGTGDNIIYGNGTSHLVHSLPRCQ